MGASTSAPMAVAMIRNLRKEEFSYAYVHAVCARAGFAVETVRRDIDSVDVRIVADTKFHKSAPSYDVQLKCSAAVEMRATDFSFPLPRKNYDDLREPGLWTPRLLIVVCVPRAEDEWLIQTEDASILKHCGYWKSLHNYPDPDSADQQNVTVHIERANRFTVDAVTQLMHKRARGERP